MRFVKKKSSLFLAGLFLLTFVLNVVAWNSRSFCDFYVKYIFPAWVNTYGRLTGMFSFSTGEVMLAVAVVAVAAALILIIAAAWFTLMRRKNAEKLRYCCRRFLRGMLWVTAVVSIVMTCNCFILYHCSTFEEKYQVNGGEYKISELAAVRDYVVRQANELAAEIERDEQGNILYEDDMKAQATASMERLSRQGYDQLAGYYPPPKGIMASGFLSQQYMLGYYFPFSMEANYNDVMHITNKPATMCHELAHLKGFIYEDEANFIGYLACIHSDDKLFRYSGYLSVLNYLDNAFYQAVGEDRDIYNSHVKISAQVKRDNVFLTEETWEKVEKKAVVSTAAVKKASRAFVDTNQKVNGIEDGIASYNRVVGLLLDYYDGVLYRI